MRISDWSSDVCSSDLALDLDRRLDCIGANELIRFECLVSVQIHNGNELVPGTSSVSTGCAVSTSANNGATVLLDGFHPGQLQSCDHFVGLRGKAIGVDDRSEAGHSQHNQDGQHRNGDHQLNKHDPATRTSAQDPEFMAESPHLPSQIGRASCRVSVCNTVLVRVVAVSLTKNI